MTSGRREGGLRRTFMASLAALAFSSPAPAAEAETQRIFALPALQWDAGLSRDRLARSFGPSDLANLTGGIVFGLTPSQVNARLPTPASGIEWASLPSANEYPEDVRYFWVRLDAVKEPRAGIQGCTGANSYVVFLFSARGLFRMSWRLLPDATCAAPRQAEPRPPAARPDRLSARG